VVIIDASTSMREEGRFDAAKEAACAMIELIHPADSFSVIAFATTAQLVYRSAGDKSARTTAADKAAAKSAIARLCPDGDTNFEQALLQAYNEFVGSHAAEGYGLMLSDGEHNKGNLAAALAVLQLARRLGRIFSVSCRRIGHGKRVELLRMICDVTFGGVVGVVQDLSKLTREFGDWIASIHNTCIHNLRLVICPQAHVQLARVVQVVPSVITLTYVLCQDVYPERVAHLGSVSNRSREFYVQLKVEPGQAVLTWAHLFVRYTYKGREYQAPLKPTAIVTQLAADKLAVQWPREVEAALDRIAYAQAVDAGLTAWMGGDEAAALNHFRQAAKLAKRWGDTQALANLGMVIHIAANGDVTLMPPGEIGRRSMQLDASATETSFGSLPDRTQQATPPARPKEPEEPDPTQT
jgi:hypothetical protein